VSYATGLSGFDRVIQGKEPCESMFRAESLELFASFDSIRLENIRTSKVDFW